MQPKETIYSDAFGFRCTIHFPRWAFLHFDWIDVLDIRGSYVHVLSPICIFCDEDETTLYGIVYLLFIVEYSNMFFTFQALIAHASPAAVLLRVEAQWERPLPVRWGTRAAQPYGGDVTDADCGEGSL